MKIKKQDRENTTEESGARKGIMTRGNKAVGKKPSKSAKPLTKKAITEKAVTSKATVVTGTPKAAAIPASRDEVKTGHRGIRKEYMKTRNVCKATFVLPGEAALTAGTVTIVGDFNGWNKSSTPLKKLENGSFSVTVELHAGQEYRFRYLIDGQRWENDWCADKYVKSPYGEEDSVICA